MGFETAPPSPILDQFEFGHTAQPIFLPDPTPLPRREPTSISMYPSFNSALSLAHRLGVTPTTQTVKRLETADMARSQARTQDPRPRKRARVDTEMEVDLEWSDNDEVDHFMEDSAEPSGEQ